MSDEPTRNKTEEEPTTGELPSDDAGNSYTPGLGPDPQVGPKDVRRAASDEPEATPQAQAQRTESGESDNDEKQTVDEVLADVDSGKVSAQDALDRERDGQNRSTLINGLHQRGAS